jgi:hypothetical protein
MLWISSSLIVQYVLTFIKRTEKFTRPFPITESNLRQRVGTKPTMPDVVSEASFVPTIPYSSLPLHTAAHVKQQKESSRA